MASIESIVLLRFSGSATGSTKLSWGELVSGRAVVKAAARQSRAVAIKFPRRHPQASDAAVFAYTVFRAGTAVDGGFSRPGESRTIFLPVHRKGYRIKVSAGPGIPCGFAIPEDVTELALPELPVAPLEIVNRSPKPVEILVIGGRKGGMWRSRLIPPHARVHISLDDDDFHRISTVNNTAAAGQRVSQTFRSGTKRIAVFDDRFEVF